LRSKTASTTGDPNASGRLHANGPTTDREAAQGRYAGGESRSYIFRDLVLGEIHARRGARPVTVLDVGCGRGFDDKPDLQRQISEACDHYLGVEPDPDIPVLPVFQSVYRNVLEEAPIVPGSIDVAFSVMVLEHVRDPARHWAAIHAALAPNGVFWGFTMDSRHWFPTASRIATTLRVKDLYLTVLHGRRGEDRYGNYPTFYRTNSPASIARWTHPFRTVDAFSLYGQSVADYYLPAGLRWVGRLLDRSTFALGGCGGVLAVKAVK
jgi:SAM-dependent methyltransferase